LVCGCFQSAHDIFALVTKKFKAWLTTKACCYWYVWSNRSYSQTLTKNLTKLLDKYGLTKKILAYVKDEASNLNVVTILRYVMSCECLGLEESFQSSYFGHTFPKVCEYVTTYDFFFQNFK
jgi:hypothetical protein